MHCFGILSVASVQVSGFRQGGRGKIIKVRYFGDFHSIGLIKVVMDLRVSKLFLTLKNEGGRINVNQAL